MLEGLGATSALVLLEEPVAGDRRRRRRARRVRGARHHAASPHEAARRADVRRRRGRRRRDLAARIPARSSRSAVARRSISARRRASSPSRAGRSRASPAARPRSSTPRLPLVTVPTTSGTGSDVSGGAVMTDKDAGRKVGLASPNMRAQYALVDPLLTVGLPPAPDGADGDRRPRPGDRRHDRDERQSALDGRRPRGLPVRGRRRSRPPCATARTSRRAAR